MTKTSTLSCTFFRIIRQLLIVAIYIIVFANIEFAQQSPPVLTTTLTAISDAYIRDGYYGNRNYGDEDVLHVKKAYGSQSLQCFLKFDLSLYGDATFESATLRLFVNANDSAMMNYIYQIDDDSWAETGISWDTKPETGAEIAQIEVASAGQYIEIDVLSAVESEKGDLLSFQILTNERIFKTTTFDSREGANPPQLVIEASNGAIPVTGITVSTSNISIDKGKRDTLSAEVSPNNASFTDVTWSSNNPRIATVDANGVVSALSSGQATITATSVDGGFTDVCNVTVNKPAISQFMNLDVPTGERFTLPDEIVWPTNIGEANVCLWHNDKYAAASLSIDDNIEGQHTWWIEKGIKYPGLVFNWMAMPVSIRSWDSFQSLIDAGHYVDAHDKCEINDFNDTDYRNRIIDNQNQITQTLTNTQCLAYAYPCGTGKAEIIRDLFIVMRGVYGVLNHANQINYLGINSKSGSNDLHDIRVLLDKNEKLFGTSYNRGWLSYHYHQLNGDYIETTDTFLAGLYAKLDSIWVGSYTDVAKYGQERDSHTLTVTEIGTENIKFNLTDLMHDLFFDFPLTVKVRVPNNWLEIQATQNDSAIEVSLVENAGNKYALVKAVPDRGTVILNATEKDPNIEDPVIEEPPKDVAVTGVEISPDVLEMKIGESHTFVATVSPSNASNQTVTWEIAPENLASIDNNGQLKALAEGTVTVTAQTDDGDFSAISNITIVPDVIASDTINVSGISISEQDLNLYINKSATLTAQVEPLNATIKTISWTSADLSVATVDENGKITAISIGTTTITATSTDGGFTALCTIEVQAQEEDPNIEEPSDTVDVEEPSDITNSIQHNACKVSIWPNPITSDKDLSVNLSGFTKGQKLLIRIIDGMGRQVYNKSDIITKEQMSFTLKLNAQLQQGYYILQISDGTQSLYRKLLIR